MDEKWKFMIGLLNRPGTLHIAQRMMNENSRLGKRSGGSAHGACWWCLLKAIGSPIVCQDVTSTHWTCLLLSLASEVASSSGEDTAMYVWHLFLLPTLTIFGMQLSQVFSLTVTSTEEPAGLVVQTLP